MGVIRNRGNKDDSDTNEEIQSDDNTCNFESLVVIEFCDDIPDETLKWLLDKIQASRDRDGAELMARTALNAEGKECTIHVGASVSRLLLAAELCELKKPYRDGSMRDVAIADLTQFSNADDLSSFLTMAEKQRLIYHELVTVRATARDSYVPGYQKLKLYEGEAIIPKLQNKHVIKQFFPLHDRDALKLLSREWYQLANVFKPQPMDKIQTYFGETVAMYFAFLGFYTMALIPPAVIGLFTLIYAPTDDVTLRVFFSVFNLIWVTLFLEAWKRHCSTLAYSWGTLSVHKFEEARPAYHGKLGVNKVTGRLEPQFPKMKRMIRFYGVSVPIIMLCLFGSLVIMFIYFFFQEMADNYYKETESNLAFIGTFLPSVVYAAVIVGMNILYRRLAKHLNDWENHRLQSAYDNHLICKLVLFDFVNSFICLFYIAFYLQDMVILKKSLASLLITTQVIGQVMESLVPYVLYKRRKVQIQTKACVRKTLLSCGVQDSCAVQNAHLEATKDVFESPAEDYLEMFLQFGYVFLFSSVFPSAAFWALLNNITEIRSDAFKLCRTFQRPFSQPTAGIGAWQAAFELMNIIAVISNCGLLILSPSVQQYTSVVGEVQLLLIFVLAEHSIIALKAFIAFLIPDEPGWVRDAVNRVDYQAKQAWRAQRLETAKKQSMRRIESEVRDSDVQKKSVPSDDIEEELDEQLVNNVHRIVDLPPYSGST